jgi:DNA-binding MarR family transcriptional regulator
MIDPTLERSFGFLIHDVSRLLRKRFDRRAQSLGMTRAQWSVIAHLHRNEGVNQSTLADTLDIQKITLARLVDRLEQSGWVVRRPDPADRRANRLFLTEKVGPMWERMRELAGEIFDEALAGLPQPDRDQLIDWLLAVKRNLAAPEKMAAANGRAAAGPIAASPLLGSTGD